VASGKTTMLNSLAGRVRLSGGSARLVDELGKETPLKHMRAKIGFVPQEDTLLPMLTVKDILLHSARLRLPNSMSDVEKVERVDNVISLLGLQRVADSQIGDVLTRGVNSFCLLVWL